MRIIFQNLLINTPMNNRREAKANENKECLAHSAVESRILHLFERFVDGFLPNKKDDKRQREKI